MQQNWPQREDAFLRGTKNKKKILNINASTKQLGQPISSSRATIGGSTSAQNAIDGDGDGFVSLIPGGPDDTPAPDRKKEQMAKGQIAMGNINLNDRPVVRNADGSISTVRSISIRDRGATVLIPTVIRDASGNGRIVSDRQAIRHYQRTGQHLGKFSTPRDATRYARQLHNDQARQYSDGNR